MAIVYSDQYADLHVDIPPTRVDEDISFGQSQMLRFTYTQAGAGNIGDVIYLRKVPPRCQIVVPYCRFQFTAWDTNTVIDIGHLAYKTAAGATVSAAAAALLNDLDVDAAGEWTQGMLITAGGVARAAPVVEVFQIRSMEPVTITATFAAAAPTTTDQFNGWLVVTVV